MSTLSSRPAVSTPTAHMLLVLDLWIHAPGVSELRISKYDSNGTPYFVCALRGEVDALVMAADVAKAAYVAAGVKYDVKEMLH